MTDLDALQALWRADDPAPPLDAARLAAVRADADKLARTLRWRDARELGAVVLVALAFGVYAWLSPEVRLASLAIIAVGVWVGGVIVGVRRRFPRAAPDAPLRQALAAEHAWLRAQTALLRWAWAWYVLPITAGIVAFDLSGTPSPLYLGLVAAGAVALGWANGRAADALAAQRDAVGNLLSDLSASPDSDASL